MIQRNDYLKDVYSMTAEEKLALRQRLADAEADGEVTLDEMLTILSAFPRAHGFISVAYQLDKARCQREIDGFTKLLKAVLPEIDGTTALGSAASQLAAEEHAEHTDDSSSPAITSNYQQLSEKNVRDVRVVRVSKKNKQHTNNTNGTNKGKSLQEKEKSAQSASSVVNNPSQGGDRPAHFDSWFDQMSPALQEKIQSLKDLHTKKLYYRQQVEQLSADPNHSKQDLSYAATLCVSYEKKIQAIYDQSQIEWDELQGRTVSDEVKKIAEQDEREADKTLRKALGDNGTTEHAALGSAASQLAAEEHTDGILSPAITSNYQQLSEKKVRDVRDVRVSEKNKQHTRSASACGDASHAVQKNNTNGTNDSVEPRTGNNGQENNSRNSRNSRAKENEQKEKSASSASSVVNKPASQMTDDELKQLTVAQLLASDLDEGPRTYFINKRVENARGYIKRWLPENPSDEQRQRAITYVQDLLDAGKYPSPKMQEALKKTGIEIPTKTE